MTNLSIWNFKKLFKSPILTLIKNLIIKRFILFLKEKSTQWCFDKKEQSNQERKVYFQFDIYFMIF